MSGSDFRDYHLLYNNHTYQIFAITHNIGELFELGGATIRTIGHIARLQRIPDNDSGYVTLADMLDELHKDEKAFVLRMHAIHALCNDAGDIATAGLLENWIAKRNQLRRCG